MRCSGALPMPTAVIAGMTSAVAPSGRLEPMSTHRGPCVPLSATSTAARMPAASPASMTGHSPNLVTARPLRNAAVPVTRVTGSMARPVPRASSPWVMCMSMARQNRLP